MASTSTPLEASSAQAPLPGSRAIGVLWLLYFVAAIGALLAAKGLTVADDPAATAREIATHAARMRSSLGLDLIGNALYIALAVALYGLFEPVHRGLARTATAFAIVGCTVQIVGGLCRSGALFLLTSGASSVAPVPEQLLPLAMLCLKLHALGYHSSLVLFAVFDLLVGWLIVRSTLLPQALGWLMMAAGVGWLCFLWPPLGTSLAAALLPLGAGAEIALMLWLIVRGASGDARLR